MAALAAQHSCELRAEAPNPALALQRAREGLSENGRVVVCGSFYTVGAVMDLISVGTEVVLP